MVRYVNGIMFSEDGSSVVLICKARPKWMAGLLNGVGGHIEAGESPVEAQCREFLEETGVKTLPSDWRKFGNISGANGQKVPGQAFSVDLFVAYSDLARQVKTTTDETIRIVDVKSLNLMYAGSGPANLIPNLRWILPLAAGFRGNPSLTECRYE